MFARLADRLEFIRLAVSNPEEDLRAMSEKLQFLIDKPQGGTITKQWIADAKKMAGTLKGPDLTRFKQLIQDAEAAITVPQKVREIYDKVLALSQSPTQLVSEQGETFLQKVEKVIDERKKGPYARFFDELLGVVNHARKEQAKAKETVS